MKTFILKTSAFVIPFFVLFLFAKYFHINDRGDLLRLGYLISEDGYSKDAIFKSEKTRKVKYKKMSEINLSVKSKFDILVIGDSFSELDNIGYQDYLVEKGNCSLLHYDRFLHENPLETLHGLLNGNLLDRIEVDYIILQSVERSFVVRGQNINKSVQITTDTITDLIQKRNSAQASHKTPEEDPFFTRANFRVPGYNIFYQFDDNAFHSQTYMVNTQKTLFSSRADKLLFLADDLDVLDFNNEEKKNCLKFFFKFSFSQIKL